MDALPDADSRREWLATMTLIRRFEERAGEMYARAKIGGFLHLSIGEEATIVGSARALRDSDYLISTYRSHGHALVRGTPPENVMAELFGRVDGCSHGRGGSMHMFDLERRFMGGYGIVGGNLPIAAGIALASDLQGLDEVTLCTFGDGASNQGTFGETLNLAALWRLPVLFMVTNNQFGMGTALRRHSAVTDLQRKGESLGVPGMRCDGMDVIDTYSVVCDALARVREERRPLLVEAVTYRFRGHSMADPEQYRSREEVERWRERDPLGAFGRQLIREGVIDEQQREQIDQEALARVDAAVEFADSSPFPAPESLYDDVYVLDGRGARHLRLRPGGGPGGRADRGWGRRRRLARELRRRARAGRQRRDPPAADRGPGRRRGRPREGGVLALMAELRYREALRDALREEMRRDERVVLMGEDIGVFGGAFKVTEGLLEEFGEARVRDTPISENTIVGVGVGAAMTGLRPGRGADDDQLRAAGVRPDRQPRGPHPLHVRRPGEGAAGGADAAGRRPPAGAHPLALPRGSVHARPRPAGGGAGDGRRRQGPADERDPRREPGDLHRARVAVRGPRRGARRGAPGALRAGPRGPRGATT